MAGITGKIMKFGNNGPKQGKTVEDKDGNLESLGYVMGHKGFVSENRKQGLTIEVNLGEAILVFESGLLVDIK